MGIGLGTRALGSNAGAKRIILYIYIYIIYYFFVYFIFIKLLLFWWGGRAGGAGSLCLVAEFISQKRSTLSVS